MSKPIEPKFCVGHHMTLGKVYEWSKFQKLASTKFDFHLIFKFSFDEIRKLLILFYSVNKEEMFTMEIEDGC